MSGASAIGANALIGSINFAGTVVALFVIDKVGSKPLLLLASGGMALALGALVVALQLHAPGSWLLGLIMLYVACFAVGLGSGVWVVITEIFPTAVRGRAASVATVALWVACTVIFFTLLSLVKAAGLFRCVRALRGVVGANVRVARRGVPETKGRTLEEIERTW